MTDFRLCRAWVILAIVLILIIPVNIDAQINATDSLIAKLNTIETATEAEATFNWLENYIPAEQWFFLAKKIISINEKFNNYKANLEIYEMGHEKELFFLLHPALPFCEPYISFDEFDTLAAVDQDLRSKALATSRSIIEVVVPENYDPETLYPLIIILHGGGSNMQKVKMHWHSSKLNEEFIKVYVQSYRHYDSFTYGWRTGDERGKEDLKVIFQEVTDTYAIDPDRIILAGISAGANFSIDVLLNQTIPAKGVLAFCPGMPNISQNESLSETPVSVYFIGGSEDFYLTKQYELAEFCSQNNIEHKHIVIEGMGHTYPPDEESQIDMGIEFLLNPSSL